MRIVWKKKEKVNGMTRIKQGFLLFPKTINGETRWLEFTKWEQRYSIGWVCHDDIQGPFWENINWID